MVILKSIQNVAAAIGIMAVLGQAGSGAVNAWFGYDHRLTTVEVATAELTKTVTGDENQNADALKDLRDSLHGIDDKLTKLLLQGYTPSGPAVGYRQR